MYSPSYYMYHYTLIQRLPTFCLSLKKIISICFLSREKVGFDTHCTLAICYTWTTGLNRETEVADKCSSASTGILNARPLCWSAPLFIPNRMNCWFRPRKTMWLCLRETVFTPCSYGCCGRAVRFTLRSPWCQRCHLIFINRLLHFEIASF